MKFLQAFFSTPVFADEDTARRAKLLNFLVNLHIAVAFSTAVLMALVARSRSVFILAAFILMLVGLGLRVLIRRGQVTLAAVVFVSMIFAAMPSIAWAANTSVGTVSVTTFQAIAVVMAGLLLGGHSALIFAGLTALVNGVFIYSELSSWYVANFNRNLATIWVTQTISFFAIAALLMITRRVLDESFQRAVRENEERRQAEAKLRYMESLYRRAIDAAGAVPYYRDFETNTYSYMGEGIFEMTGYTAAEMTPALWDSLELERYPRGQLAGLTYEEANVFVETRNDIPWECDYLIRTRSGQTRWVADTAVIGMDAQGKLSGVIGILQDITERKLAEQKIAQTARQLSILNEIGRAVSELNNLDTVLEIIRQQLEKIIPFDLYSVRLFQDDYTVRYLAVYESGRYWPEPDSRLMPGTHAYKVFTTGESILHLLTEEELDAYRRGPYPRIGDHNKMTASLIFVPLKKAGKIIGALSVQRHAMNAYTEDDLKLV
ncbi:MAG: PAS domain-containing protein, partial [Anaerolineales bacterium]